MSRSLPTRPLGHGDGRSLAVRATLERFCPRRRGSLSRGLTLVEMLVAMAVTLLIMAAVVTVFANISGSVTRRRATIEMSGTLRGVRELLAKDLAGATCPALPWRRPEANEGYLEIIEGPSTDAYPTPWLYSFDTANVADTDARLPGGGNPTITEAVRDDTTDRLTESIGSVPGLDLGTSTLPGSTLRDSALDDADDDERFGRVVGSEADVPRGTLTDGRGLGDADDTLMFTVRNEDDLFNGRIPARDAPIATTPFIDWRAESVESPLAEIAWFALENPVERADTRTFVFGDPGYRTIYRRVLLILPDLDYGFVIPGTQQRVPRGVVRVLQATTTRDEPQLALAALVAFQDRYDLSVRLEWDPTLDVAGRWVLRANTLGDLTKPENRFEHHGLVANPTAALLPRPDLPIPGAADRHFPFAVVSAGLSTDTPPAVQFVADPELGVAFDAPEFRAVYFDALSPGGLNYVVAYEPNDTTPLADARRFRDANGRTTQPFCFVTAAGDVPATARAVMNEDGSVAHVTRGLAPLGGNRRGEDVVLTDALGFDLRLFDPGAPLFGYHPGGYANDPEPAEILRPGEPAWYIAAANADPPNTWEPNYSNLGPDTFVYQPKQGDYVDAGYGWSPFLTAGSDLGRIAPANRFVSRAPNSWGWQVFVNGLANQSLIAPRFDGFDREGFNQNPLASNSFVGLVTLATQPALPRTWLFRSYDTWSWHYEANGVNEDADVDELGRATIDEGTNGLDDFDPTVAAPFAAVTTADAQRYGVDDPLERETRPPFDAPLRGLQVKLRVYERDSRQIREATVRQAFVPN